MGFRSKKELELELEKLKGFLEPSWELEQYATPASIAADWLWQAALKSDLSGQVILDAACGPGILGIGALLLGAKKVYFLDKSESSIKLCQKNYEKVKSEYEIGEAEFITSDIRLFDQEVDLVLQNPPFGTKEKHIDKLFLETAFKVSKKVWSMHKSVTKSFVEAISKNFQFEITDYYEYDFPIKATFKFHTKPVQKVRVGLWRMES